MKSPFVAVLLLTSLLTAADVQAEIIVNVDMSDLNAVTFTTTEAFAEGSFSGSTENGFTLKDFFAGNSTSVLGVDVGSTLSVFDDQNGLSRKSMTHLWVGRFLNGGFTLDDVAFYANELATPIYSFDDRRALTGTATVNMTVFTELPSLGTTGNIHFNLPNENEIIGQWQVTAVAVPEPASGMLVGLGSLALLLRRRKT
jgi:hypothetical protein